MKYAFVLVLMTHACFHLCLAQKRIVVLGSSTAAGTGASTYDSSWVGRLQSEFRKNTASQDPDTIVTNLAVGGYVTYYIMPTDYTPPLGRPSPDSNHNLTKALGLSPDVILINLPTNDVGNGYSENEIMNNFRYLFQQIKLAGVKGFITTSQPRSQYVFAQRQMLRQLVDSINAGFGAYAINFWDDLTTADSQYLIKPDLNLGDGIHVNNLGHCLLFERVRAKNILSSSPPPLPSLLGGGVSIKTEAENWIAMSGVKTETVYDAGGGLNVGWIDQGDWMNYSINVPSAGTYTANLRVATPNNGAQVQIKSSSGTLLSAVMLPNTGAYQSWQTISTTLNLAAGVQTIRLQSAALPFWNINWLEITGGGSVANQPPVANAGADQVITLPVSSVTLAGKGSDADGSIASYTWSQVSGPLGSNFTAPSSTTTIVNGLVQGSYIFHFMVTDNKGSTASDDIRVTVNGITSSSSTTHIEAENWTAMSGVQTETVYDAGGGKNVGWIDRGDWIEYSINPSVAGTYAVKLRVATPNNGAQLQVKSAAGTVLATLTLPNTGAYQTWQTAVTTITLAAGQQVIRLQSSATPFWNINWLELVPPVTSLTLLGRTTNLSTSLVSSASTAIFPNPASDCLVLRLDNDWSGPVNVRIISLQGNVVKQFSLTKPTAGLSQFFFSIGELATAGYLVEINMKGQRQYVQIIKQ